MDLSTQIVIAVLIVGSVLLQFGDHRLALWRLISPVAIVAFVGVKYLTGFPTAGTDLIFELSGAAIGIITGLVAAVLMGVGRDTRGNVIVSAGIAYAAFWIVVFGARIAFAYAATNSANFARQLGIFSYQHGITGAAAWTAFFILQAILMVGVRTAVVAGRAYLNPHAEQRLAA